MNKDSALVALQTIDVIVYKSSHQNLSEEDMAEMQAACKKLVHSVQGNAFFMKKATWIVDLIQAAFLKNTTNPGVHQKEILQCGISLSLWIQRGGDSSMDATAWTL